MAKVILIEIMLIVSFLPSLMNAETIKYLDFRSGGVVESHIVKLNISFDPVKLISSLG